MKKITILLPFILLISIVNGQLPNGSFETWVSTSYDEPTGWMTGNHEAVSIGLTPVTKTNGLSGFAVRMETLVSNGDTAQAYITNGDPMSGQGGMPFSEQPSAITGFYKYSLPGNDSAIMLVMFKKNGIIFNQNIFKIHGTGTQSTFIQFSFPLSVPIAPDSVILAFASSNLIDNVGVQGGSFLELDGIAFTGASAPIDNNNFENWTTNSNNAIDGWETYGDGVSRTTDSYDGNYAISMTTVDYGNGNIGSSGMTSGHFGNNGSTGGTPYTLSSDTLVGYYKYSCANNDSAGIWISLSSNGNQIGGAGAYLTAASQYTYFEIPFSAMQTPDSIRIDISSSNYPVTQTSAGSTLIIDQIMFKSDVAAGTNSSAVISNSVFAYPNPAKETLNIIVPQTLSDKALVEIYDLSGRLVLKETKSIADNRCVMKIGSLKSGKYYYRVVAGNVETMHSFSKN